MAQKQKATRPKQTPNPSDPLARLQSSMRSLQKDAETLLGQTRKRATQLIGRDQKQTANRLLDEARKLRKDIEGRVREAGKRLEGQIEKLLSSLEREANSRISAVLQRLDVASQEQIQDLSRRIAQLEKKIKS